MEITFRQFADQFGMSDEACKIAGISPWCLNEGTAHYNDTLYLSEKQCKLLRIPYIKNLASLDFHKDSDNN